MNKPIEDKVEFENGKYTLALYKDGNFELLRHHKEWSGYNPHYSKMLIGILYEVQALRKLLDDIQYDFDPGIGQLGPAMLKRILEHQEHYGDFNS